MASSKSTQAFAPSPLRREVARVACYEVEQLSLMLRDYLEENDSTGQLAPVMRGGLLRLAELSDIIYSSVISREESDSDMDLVRRVGGSKALAPGVEVQNG
jgi:hypothetical protein